MFGVVGRAALMPLYARVHGLSHADHDQLTHGLRKAITILLFILKTAEPRRVLLARPTNEPTAVAYTDAFFMASEMKVTVGMASSPDHPVYKRDRSLKNGWGFVAHCGGQVLHSCGKLPASFGELTSTCLKSWQF